MRNLFDLTNSFVTFAQYRVIKSRRIRCAGDVARMEEDKIAFKILTGKPTERPPH